MSKFAKNESGIAHLGLVLLVSAVIVVVGFAGSRVYTSKNNGDVLGSSSTASKPKIKSKVSKSTAASGSIQYVVREQVKDGNKTKYVPRGNVQVELTATTDKQRCRDAGKIYVKKGNVVFSGKTDADKAHKGNVGKIKADSCTAGNYKASINLSDKYEVVGESSKIVTLNKKKLKKIAFTIKKKGTAATTRDANTQNTAPVPTPTPAPQPTAPITKDQEKAAIDTTFKYESDMFFKFSKTCPTAETDPGEILDVRKSNFAKNSSTYMTKELIAKVNSQMGGDAFPLLGVSDLRCGQYSYINTKESKPLVSTGSGTSAIVEHQFTATARQFPYGGYPKANDLTKTWVYNLVREGNLWKIDSIQVK